MKRVFVCCFFFSSRRRHTRSKRDWSSDVCSSDLGTQVFVLAVALLEAADREMEELDRVPTAQRQELRLENLVRPRRQGRSEERRVGKERRGRRGSGLYKKISMERRYP